MKKFKLFFIILIIIGAVGAAAAFVIGQSGLKSGSSKSTTRSSSKQSDANGSKWVKLASLAGNSEQKTSTFHSNGNKQRISYSLAGGDYATLYVYIVGKGQKRGDFPDVDLVSNQSGSKTFAKPAGDYYLLVDTSQYGSYSVKVEDWR